VFFEKLLMIVYLTFSGEFDVGLSSLSEVEQGVQHVLADIMAKDIEIINAIRQRYVVLSVLILPANVLSSICEVFSYC